MNSPEEYVAADQLQLDGSVTSHEKEKVSVRTADKTSKPKQGATPEEQLKSAELKSALFGIGAGLCIALLDGELEKVRLLRQELKLDPPRGLDQVQKSLEAIQSESKR